MKLATPKVERLPPVRTSLSPTNHPYMTGPWTPQHEEVNAWDLEVLEGEIPADLDGVYLRNTENPLHDPLGRYHPFDGDGMIHQIEFKNGQATYRNRFVRTRCFEAEQEVNESLWGGLMDGTGTSKRPGFGAHGSLKDSASTDIVVHNGEAIATFYQCGEAYRLDPLTLETLGVASWAPLDGVSAHPKVDENTGELLFFNYSKSWPYMHYGVVGPDGKRSVYQGVPLPGPRLSHDMGFSEHWAILNDLPVFWDQELMARDIHAERLHKGLPSRFALVTRHGGELVLDDYFQEKPIPRPLEGAPDGHGHLMAYLDEHSFLPKLHRWRFNLKTGQTSEKHLDDRVLEFGMFNQKYAGKPYRYAYSTTAKPGWFLFNGFVKHDLETGESWSITLPDGRYASEAPFAPKVGAKDEDDGYLVSLIIDENRGTSECVIVDAKRFEIVCRVALPHKLSSGTHSVWAGREMLRG